MARFTFKLESLLTYRLYRRDRIRALYAGLLARKETLVMQRKRTSGHRWRQLEEIRKLAGAGAVDVAAASARRFHAGRLAAELIAQQHDLNHLDEQLRRCRSELADAEKDVEVLQRLKDRQRRRFEYDQRRRSQQELDDVWSSARCGESAR